MKCSGKCACGNGVHVRPVVGQRWAFNNNDGTSYVAEIININSKNVKCRVVETRSTINGGVGSRKIKNTRFIADTLKPNGPIIDPDFPRARKLYWTYLPGQERPST